MAWHAHPDGSKHCDVCNVEFRAPHSCACPRTSSVSAPPALVGEMERLTAEAAAEGMLNRLGCERLLAERIRLADREAYFYRRRSRKIVREGLLKVTTVDGEQMRIEADADAAAVKWAALAESSRGRGDKLARALHTIVTDRERRAELEQRERLAGLTGNGKAKAPARGAA